MSNAAATPITIDRATGRRLLAVLLLAPVVLTLIGCSSTPSSLARTAAATAPPTGASTTEPVSTTGPAASELAGLHHVQVDAARGATAMIDASGGTVTTAAADGTTYTLSIPPSALATPTAVGMYPVTGLSTLPSGSTLTAGVQFTPEGLGLRAAATLTVTLPAGVDTERLRGAGWRGDGDRTQRYPVRVDGRSVTLPVFHFSGVGLTPGDVAAALGCDIIDPEECEADAFLATFAATLAQPDPRAQLLQDLRFAYANIVVPAFDNGVEESQLLDAGRHPDREDATAYPYLVWLNMIDAARLALGDPTFTVAPEVGQARVAAAAFLRRWYQGEDAQCRADKDDPNVRTPIFWAETAYSKAATYATNWAIATTANQLDVRSLLDELCVQVVIDSGRSYSASVAGDTGSISIRAGFSIAGGPVRSSPNPVRVTVTSTGTTTVLFDHDTEADGTVTVPDVVWPETADPIQFDIRAALTDNVGGSEVLSPIARFDRITNHSERLSFTFDSDLDGWSRGSVGPKGAANWGTVYWLPKAGGSVQIDGTGNPITPNAWLFRTFHLPVNTEAMTYDVSAHNRIGADTKFIVRILEAGVGTTVRNEILTHSGPDGALSFRTETVDLRRWAGKTVTIYFEQNDNGIDGSFPGGNEQVHLDNIRITRG